MMLAGFLGMSTKFAEVTLAVKYRQVRADGTVTGGAMYYVPVALQRRRPAAPRQIPRGLLLRGRGRRLAHHLPGEPGLRAVPRGHGLRPCLPVRADRRGVDRHRAVRRRARASSSGPTSSRPSCACCTSWPAWWCSAANYANIPGALATIVREAFAPHAVAGGVIGALIQGFRRAAFANEAGLGSAPMAHATVRTNEPMSQGFAALMEPFLDTVVICLLTALVVVVSGVYQTSASEGIALTSDAFATVVPWFPAVLAVVAILFALSTVLSWGYYGEQAWTWLFSEQPGEPRRVPAVPVLRVVGRRDARRSSQVVNIVDSLQFLHGDPEPHRRLSAVAGAARRSRQLLAARGAEERRARDVT